MELLPADAAGIVLGDARRELRAVAASDEAAHVMELLQLQSDEGPCLDCFQTAAAGQRGRSGRGRPTGGRRSWRRSQQRGDFRSVHALPLRLRGRAIGALNLFGEVPGPLPELDLALGQALADVATIGILQERAIRRGEVLNEQLQLRAEQSRHHRAGQGRPGAVRRADHRPRRSSGSAAYARSHNLKLSDVARRIVEKEFDLTEIIPPSTPSRRRR